MKIDVLMPQMGESITEGTIVKWLKKPGDKVKRDETLLEISTDKVDTQIPAPETGVLAEILAKEAETVEVGALLARIDTEQAAAESTQAAEKREEPPKTPAPPAPETLSEETAEEELPRLSPVARNVAEQEGLALEDLRRIRGSGPRGRIVKEDVLSFVQGRTPSAPKQPPPGAPPAGEAPRQDKDRVEVLPMSVMRKKIAEHMVMSKRTSPHVYTVAEVDMSAIAAFRERAKRQFEEREGFNLTFTPFILFSAVQALLKWPIVNSSLEGDNILVKRFVNLGVAVAIPDGLIVPVIKNADEKSFLGLARANSDLSLRAKEKRLQPDDVQGGTFTVTNPGIFRNLFGLPIINQPQVAILGVGAVKKRPVVINDAIGIRSMMYATLSYDHRVIDGAIAGQFLQEVVRNLEQFDWESAL
jgi:pyruvate dehydrogenase E2 component (dihydrolipoamide acetyltransferase)